MRVLPMPGSPTSASSRPRPDRASSRAAFNSPISRCRPTNTPPSCVPAWTRSGGGDARGDVASTGSPAPPAPICARVAETLARKPVHLHVLDQHIDTSDATGRFLFHLLGAIAPFRDEAPSLNRRWMDHQSPKRVGRVLRRHDVDAGDQTLTPWDRARQGVRIHNAHTCLPRRE